MPSFLDRLRIRHARLIVYVCDCFCNKAAMDDKKRKLLNLATKERIFSHVELQYIVYVKGRKIENDSSSSMEKQCLVYGMKRARFCGRNIAMY